MRWCCAATTSTYARFAQVLSLAAAESGNPLFGLQLSRYHDYLVLGPFGLLLAQADSFAEVLKLTQNYVHLHAQGIQLSCIEQGETLEVRYALALSERVDCRQLLELGLGVVHRSLNSLFDSAWRPSRLSFQHAAQAPQECYAEFFPCEVCFAQPHNARWSSAASSNPTCSTGSRAPTARRRTWWRRSPLSCSRS